MTKILFIGVFDADRKSTNTSQLLSFKKLGHQVAGYNYREKALKLGNQERDAHLISVVENNKFDLVVYSKCNVVSEEVFKRIQQLTHTCLWFMDPLVSYNDEMRRKTRLVDYFCCDKINVLEEALKINTSSFHVCEGYDEDIEKPHDVEKIHDVSFIGNIYGDREEMIKQISHPIRVISDAHGAAHALQASKTKINLNFCTSNGASDRVYKILAARGFLLTNDWTGRQDMFNDKKDFVIFDNVSDLNEKIEYYLVNQEEASKIAKHGNKTVKQYTRLKWAEKIVDLHEQLR